MNRITIEEFSELPDQEQQHILSSAGELIDSGYAKDQKTELYSIDRFFVEVNVEGIPFRTSSIKAFDTGEELNKYSSSFNDLLSHLLHS